jgi:hypothetical protein
MEASVMTRSVGAALVLGGLFLGGCGGDDTDDRQDQEPSRSMVVSGHDKKDSSSTDSSSTAKKSATADTQALQPVEGEPLEPAKKDDPSCGWWCADASDGAN